MSEFHEKKCYGCGKGIIVHDADEYVYRRQMNSTWIYFCSWSCLRKFDAKRGSKIDRRERIIQALEDGLSVAEVCTMLDVDRRTVSYWKEKMGKQ